MVQAGIFLLAAVGFTYVLITLKRHGAPDFSELVNEDSEQENDVRDLLRQENIEN